MGKKMTKLTLVGVLTAALCLPLGSTAMANAGPEEPALPAPSEATTIEVTTSGDVTHVAVELELDPALREDFSTAEARNTVTGEVVRPFLDPPLGGCDFGDLSGTVHAYYLDGMLSETNTSYQSSVSCLTTAPGQTMEHMSDHAVALLNSVQSSSGTVDDCNYTPGNPCTFAFSIGTFPCIGSVCAGVYQLQHYPTMLLPEDRLWTTWPAGTCTPLAGNRELYCYTYSDTYTVPLVY